MKPGASLMRGAGAARLLDRWRSLPARQRLLAATAAIMLAAVVAWWLALQPALAVLRSAPAQHHTLDAQLQRMLRLQAQARALEATAQSMPPLSREEARHALEVSVRQRLGDAARVTAMGDGVTLVITGVSGDALAQWLVQTRIEARTLATEARLTRNPAGLWEGQLTLALPAR